MEDRPLATLISSVSHDAGEALESLHRPNIVGKPGMNLTLQHLLLCSALWLTTPHVLGIEALGLNPIFRRILPDGSESLAVDPGSPTQPGTGLTPAFHAVVQREWRLPLCLRHRGFVADEPIEYISDRYELTADLHDQKLVGTWHRTDGTDQGTWDAPWTAPGHRVSPSAIHAPAPAIPSVHRLGMEAYLQGFPNMGRNKLGNVTAQSRDFPYQA